MSERSSSHIDPSSAAGVRIRKAAVRERNGIPHPEQRNWPRIAVIALLGTTSIIGAGGELMSRVRANDAPTEAHATKSVELEPTASVKILWGETVTRGEFDEEVTLDNVRDIAEEYLIGRKLRTGEGYNPRELSELTYNVGLEGKDAFGGIPGANDDPTGTAFNFSEFDNGSLEITATPPESFTLGD